MRSITVAEAHEAFKGQGVSEPKHYAFICPVCGTVQSMASLVKAGDTPEMVERHIAFNCEGRFSGAGPWNPGKSKKARDLRKIRGCDWTLGGLFQFHTLEIVDEEGNTRPAFEIASPEQAQELERLILESETELVKP
jgi:hypothetical protein